MALTKFVARVAEKKDFNAKFLGVKLELVEPHRIEFSAGQYIIMDVPGIEAKRNYSIASLPEMNHAIELVADITPDGPGSSYFRAMKPGDEVKFMAPVGRFVVAKESQEEKLVFVATGSGITPFKSMIADLLVSKMDKREMKLHWGLRFIEDLFWEEEWYQLTEEHENFGLDIVLSRPRLPEWKLCSGRVTDCLRGHGDNFEGTRFYLCGSQGMIEDTKTLLLDQGVQEDKIHYEKFY